MKKTIFSNGAWMKLASLLAFIPLIWGCGQSSLAPTSANSSSMTTSKVTANAATSSVTATAGDAWVNTAFAAQTSDFTAAFTASVSAEPANAIIALSNGAQTAYADFASLVRFNPSGDIDAYNGTAYAGPSTAVPYKVGTAYSFTVVVHMAAQTYDISVSSAGGASQIIGTGFKFRASAASLNNYGAYVSSDGGSGTLTVNGFTVTPVVSGPTATPTFTSTPTNTFTSTFTSTFTPTFTMTNTPTKVPPTATPITVSTWRVVAGGPAHTDCQGNVWAADENYSGGTAATSTNAITGALPCSTDGALYQDQRYGSFSYVFNIPAGSYQVDLKFAETYFTAAGDREFNVSINGSTVLTNFDIFTAAGGQNKAVDELFNNIAPSGGTITITFGPAAVNNAMVSSIQIIPQSTAPPTATPTHTPVPPTATPTPQSLNIDFADWYLQLPSGSGTDPNTVSNTTLEKGYSSPYFYIASDGWQAYMDPKTGITTSGSAHPRCEMHEESTWASSGTNTLTVTGKATLIDGDTTTVGQIFNNNDSITLVELQYSKSLGGFQVFYEEAKGEGSYPTQTTAYVGMNTPYTYQLSLTGGVAKVTINGSVVFTKTVSSAVSGNQFYFKAGNYDQSATAGSVSTTPYSIIEIGSAVIVHK